MMIVNSLQTYAKDAIDLDKKAVLMSSTVTTYKLTKEEMDREFNKYDTKFKINKKK